MLFILLNETKSFLNTKKILWDASLDYVWHQNYFFLLLPTTWSKLCQCYARQQEVAKGSNIRSWCKILNENVWSRLNVESNSTQTYLCGDTQRQQRKAERRKRTSSLIFVLPMFPCVSSPVIHVSLAFRTRLILGDPGADSGDEKNKSFLTPIRSQNDGDLLELVL